MDSIKQDINDVVVDVIPQQNNIPQNNNIPIYVAQPQNIIDMTQINNWNEQNNDTLRNWKTSLVQSIFIYQFILDKTQIKFNRILFTVEILGGISSIISLISATILSVSKGLNPFTNSSITPVMASNSAIDYIALALTITVAVISLTLTVIMRIIKIYKWDTTISLYLAYITKMDGVYSTLAIELTKPKYLRSDANDFINSMALTFSELIKNSPNIDIEDQELAGAEYVRYINGKSTNYNITQKYAYNDSNISVI